MYKKILVTHRSGIGDVILGTPILKGLKDKFPDSHLMFLTGPLESFVAGLSFIDEMVVYEKGTVPVLDVVKQIWRADIALFLDFTYRSAFLSFLARIPIRAGLRHKRGLFMTHPVAKSSMWQHRYESCNYADVIKESTGITLENDLTELYVPERTNQDISFVNGLLLQSGADGSKPIITIAPFTSWGPKNWPVERFIELIRKLNSDNEYHIALIGTAEDFERSKELQQLAGAVNLMGKATILQTIEVIARSRLVVGGCSAPLHMAAATHTPLVGLYGATSPDRWAPRKNSIILYKKQDCSPCNDPLIGCDEKRCMLSIAVDEVYTACQTLLNRR